MAISGLKEYKEGKPTTKLKKGAKTKQTGTKITFEADPKLFPVTKFSVPEIKNLIEIKAFLNKGLRINFVDKVNDETETFQHKEGIKEYLETLLKRYKVKSILKDSFYLEGDQDVKVELALTWTESTQSKILSFVNGIPTGSGGTHEDGFKSGLAKAIRNYINVHDIKLKGVKLTADDFREGLIAIVSVNVPGSVAQLQFQGQTKDKLNNPEVLSPVENLTKTLENLLNSQQAVANQIVERITLSAKARQAARQASQSVSRKIGASRRLNLPGKLSDCSSNKADKSELFIVEGDSAGGTAKQGRDRKTQAIFPLRGKVMNTISSPNAKVMANQELMD